MSSGSIFDEDYFLRGKATGKSLYENYRWLPSLTIPMAQSIVNHCCIHRGARILDFGCARGYVVKALRGLGYDAFGVDISHWAIDNADEETKPYLECVTHGSPYLEGKYDWIIAKDVLEHVQFVDLVIPHLMSMATEGIFAVVPLSRFDRGRYIIEDYEKDVTHIQRWKLTTWASMFMNVGWCVELAYRVPGVKCNYYKPGWESGNGFITCRRIKEE